MKQTTILSQVEALVEQGATSSEVRNTLAARGFNAMTIEKYIADLCLEAGAAEAQRTARVKESCELHLGDLRREYPNHTRQI